jgi:hypothetical protein
MVGRGRARTCAPWNRASGLCLARRTLAGAAPQMLCARGWWREVPKTDGRQECEGACDRVPEKTRPAHAEFGCPTVSARYEAFRKIDIYPLGWVGRLDGDGEERYEIAILWHFDVSNGVGSGNGRSRSTTDSTACASDSWARATADFATLADLDARQSRAIRPALAFSAGWTGGRVVECTALEMRHTGNRIGGSNPSLSAT